jgi:peptidoglycan/xylan/chitin deacetylase (PgdA/CDA1 family)
MNRKPKLEGDEERHEFLGLIEAAQAQSGKIAFWWRDDDAVTVTPELERLLALASRFDLPLCLAVIPKNATQDLADRLAAEPLVRVLQHGWSHRLHSPEGEKKMELGHRPPAEILAELRRGRSLLEELIPERFLPVLVPPWNRIGDEVIERLSEAGIVRLSTFGGASPRQPQVVDTHVDLIDWSARQAISRSEAYLRLAREVQKRLDGDTQPIGILTHHLVHREPAWELLEELLSVLGAHPAVSWPSAEALFHLQGSELTRSAPKNPRP